MKGSPVKRTSEQKWRCGSSLKENIELLQRGNERIQVREWTKLGRGEGENRKQKDWRFHIKWNLIRSKLANIKVLGSTCVLKASFIPPRDLSMKWIPLSCPSGRGRFVCVCGGVQHMAKSWNQCLSHVFVSTGFLGSYITWLVYLMLMGSPKPFPGFPNCRHTGATL